MDFMSNINYKDLLKEVSELAGYLNVKISLGDSAVPELDAWIRGRIAEINACLGDPEDVAERIESAAVEADDSGSVVEADDTERIAGSAIDEEEMMADEPAPAVHEVVIGDAAAQMRPESVEEKLARERAADLGKAFTLNDKFRFRRELFRDSAGEMNDAIGVISRMSTLEEAQEYIYDDLCLDPDNADVKDFMEIIARHF